MPLPPLVEPVEALSSDERERTARHAVLSGFGELGQRRLAAAHVAIVGAGGLGSPAMLALAAAGVGTVTMIDDDVVEATNLQRQVLHRIADVGAPKVDSAVRAAADLSPETRVIPDRTRLTAQNAAAVLSGAHVVIDGTDTFESRRIVASACRDLGVPLVWGVIQEFHAQVTVFWSAPPPGVPAVGLDDLYPPGSVGEVPTCAQAGVLGALCLQVGGVLASEAIKLIAGVGEPLLGRILVIDALRGRTHEVPLGPARASVVGSAEADAIPQLSPADTDAARDTGVALLDVREPSETATGVIPGSVLRPLADVLADPAAVADHTRGSRLVVVCKGGARAQRAAGALRRSGVDAVVLAGGIDAWTREGRSTTGVTVGDV